MPCVGSLIRNARLRLGLTQSELAALVQTHPTRVSRLESGREHLGLSKAELYAQVLHLDRVVIVREVLRQSLAQEGLSWRVILRHGTAEGHAYAAIRTARLERGLSLQEVASALGVSRPRVAEIERGDKLLKLASARNVARVLRLPEKRITQWVLQDALGRECATPLVVSLR